MKLIHEDSENYHLQHPSGRTMVVSKAGMSPEAHSLVHHFSPAHFDGGGQAQPSPSPDPNNPASMGVPANVLKAFKMANGGEPPRNDEMSQSHAQIQDEVNNPVYRPNQQQQLEQDMNQTTQERQAQPQQKANGGDVYNHQTKDYPNPKLAQVPEKDRMPGQIVQHFHFGGQAPQNFADGGGASFLQPPAPPPPQDYVTAAPASNSPDAQAVTGGAAPQAPPAPSQPGNVPQDLMGEATAASNQTNSGIQKEAAAKGQESAQTAQALGQEQPALDAQTQRMEENGQNYHEAWDKIANNMDPTIDPNHYWNSKSTSGKIISAIGFMLGGAGLGVAGHADLAGKAVQDAINHDIDAQKATFANKDNLLSQYTNQYHSTILGEDALRLQYGAQYENMIKRAAAQAGTPIAQAQAQQAIGANRQALVGNMSNLAQGQTAIDLANLKRQYINQPGGPGGGQQAQGPGAGMVDSGKLNQLQITGLMPQPDVKAATQEAQGLEGVESLRNDYNQTFNALNKKFLAGALTPGDRQSAIWTLAGKLQHVSAGRFNLEDAKKQMDAMFPQPLDWGSTSKDRQLHGNALFDTMSSNTPTLDRYGLRRRGNQNSQLEGKTATGPNGQRVIMKNGQWVPFGG